MNFASPRLLGNNAKNFIQLKIVQVVSIKSLAPIELPLFASRNDSCQLQKLGHVKMGIIHEI